MPVSEAYCIDCMEYMRSIPDKFFDLAVVDPPYGINATKMNMGTTPGNQSTATRLRKGRLNSGSGKLKRTAIQRMPADWDYEQPGPDYFQELFRVSRNQIIWGGNYFQLPPTRGIICWDKLQRWENFSQIELAWTSFNCPAKIVRISNRGGANNETRIHPTQKPVNLYAWIYEKYARDGDRILDTHMGSGSSRIAAFFAGLDYYGTEIDPVYFKDSQTRFERACKGIICTENETIIQPSLFEL